MNDVNHKEVLCALEVFIKRASEKDATPEEIAALPKVAQVYLDFVLSRAL